ncbi:MAG TPA: hypothetical protein VFA96_07045 [Nocardioides sp.]|nr:hypothetical protein [Nocardioides sp.]
MAAAKKSPAKKVAKGAKVVDPKGKPGTVVGTAGMIAKVRHTDGSTDTHPMGALKKSAAKKKGK